MFIQMKSLSGLWHPAVSMNHGADRWGILLLFSKYVHSICVKWTHQLVIRNISKLFSMAGCRLGYVRQRKKLGWCRNSAHLTIRMYLLWDLQRQYWKLRRCLINSFTTLKMVENTFLENLILIVIVTKERLENFFYQIEDRCWKYCKAHEGREENSHQSLSKCWWVWWLLVCIYW